MKATLLAIATQRSALIDRMQNVASTRPAAPKPTPSMPDRLLIPLSRLPCSGARTLEPAPIPPRRSAWCCMTCAAPRGIRTQASACAARSVTPSAADHRVLKLQTKPLARQAPNLDVKVATAHRVELVVSQHARRPGGLALALSPAFKSLSQQKLIPAHWSSPFDTAGRTL